MMLDQSQGQLPFPCDAIVDGNWISDPYSVALPVPQATQETSIFLQAVAGGLVTLLQNAARTGYISAFAYNLFSNNRFNNEVWMAVVSDCYDLATKIQTCNPQVGQDQVLNLAIRKYHAYAVANCINHYPALQQIVPTAQVNAAIQAVNGYTTEIQLLQLQYNKLQQAQNQNTGMIGMLSPTGGGNTNQLPAPNLVGGLAALGSHVNIMQAEQTETAGWGGGRKRPAGSPPLEQAPVAERVPPADVITQVVSAATISNTGDVSMTAIQSLTPRRARRREEQEDVADLPEPAPAPRAAPAPAAQQTLDPISMTVSDGQVVLDMNDIVLEEPVASVEERPQIQERKAAELAKPVQGASNFRARELILPLTTRAIPDSLEEAKWAVQATDARNDQERLGSITMECHPIGEADAEGADPFGVYMSEEGHLVTVVGPEDRGWMPSAEQQIRVRYNPMLWHRALVQRCTADHNLVGPVVEGFIQREEGDPVNYLDLEIDPTARAKALAKLDHGKQYIPLAGELLEITGVDRLLLPIGTHHSVEKKDTVASENAQNMAPEIPKVAYFQAVRGKRKEAIVSCVELSNVLLVSEESYMGATIPAGTSYRARAYAGGKRLTVVQMGRPTRYLREQLVELMSHVPGLAKAVDRQVAKDVNGVLEFGFGYAAVDITSFVSDYSDLVDHLLDLYNEDTVALFEKAVDEKLKRWSITDDGKEIAIDGDALGVVVSCALEDLGVQLLSENYAMFTVSDCLNLTNIIAAGTSSESNNVVSPDLYLMGLDGDVWKAHPSVFDPSFSILIRQ